MINDKYHKRWIRSDDLCMISTHRVSESFSFFMIVMLILTCIIFYLASFYKIEHLYTFKCIAKDT